MIGFLDILQFPVRARQKGARVRREKQAGEIRSPRDLLKLVRLARNDASRG